MIAAPQLSSSCASHAMRCRVLPQNERQLIGYNSRARYVRSVFFQRVTRPFELGTNVRDRRIVSRSDLWLD
jgi:hypothetical protein